MKRNYAHESYEVVYCFDVTYGNQITFAQLEKAATGKTQWQGQLVNESFRLSM
jgi:hypothetical protein